MRKKILAAIAALAAFTGVGLVSADSASAVTTYKYRYIWSCANSAGDHRGTLTEYWTINYNLTAPTKYTLSKVVWSTAPDFKTNRVEALFTGTTNGPQVMFAFGGSASTLDDVSAEKVLSPGPNVFGGSSNSWNGPTRGAPAYVAEQKLGIWGVGAGASTATCTDSSASGPVDW